jgi:hypothetical protein
VPAARQYAELSRPRLRLDLVRLGGAQVPAGDLPPSRLAERRAAQAGGGGGHGGSSRAFKRGKQQSVRTTTRA